MWETQSACFCRSGSTLKPCLMTFTPFAEPSILKPSFDIQDKKGYSLPLNHTPIVLPLRVGRLLDPGLGAAGELQARAFEGLRNIDQRYTLLARGERRRHPIDNHVGATTGYNLRRSNVRAAGIDGHVEPGLLVEAFLLGNEVTGELRLRDPLELDRDLVGGMRGGERNAECKAGPRNHHCFLHVLMLHKLPSQVRYDGCQKVVARSASATIP